MGVVSGVGLAVGGVGLQALFGNPLADPYVLGVASGGALGYAVGLALGFSGGLLSVPSAVGALAALALVYALSRRRGVVSTGRLLLGGVAVGFFASALTSVFMILARREALSTFYVLWGNLGRPVGPGQLPYLALLGALTLALLAPLWFSAPGLDALSLGEAEARALGVSPERMRLMVFLCVGLSVGLITSLVGAVGFVGLVVPHVARLLGMRRHALLVPGAGLLGGAFVLLSDLATRLLGFYELPVGVVTSLLGVPFFIYLMRGVGDLE